jgi:hypothetical protein
VAFVQQMPEKTPGSSVFNPHSPDNALSFAAALRDSGIAISILPWIERGSHGAPKG